MKHKLIIGCLFIFYFGNSQQFSSKNLQTDAQIEVALDSAYQWMENTKLLEFTDNYLAVENAIELSKNPKYAARFNAYKASFYAALYDDEKFDYFLSMALEYYENNTDREMLIYVYNLKSIYTSYVGLNRAGSLLWNRKALELLNGDKKLEEKAVDVHFNMAVSAAELKDWNTTYEASTKCIELAKKYSTSRLPRMYYYKGLALLKKNKIHEAISSFKQAEDYIKAHELVSGKKVFYKDASYLFGYSEAYRMLKKMVISAEYLREYSARVDKSVYSYTESIGRRIQKNSKLLVGLSKKKEELAEEQLRKSEVFYNLLTIGLAILIIGVLLIFIFQQRKHEKLNIKKNHLLTSKNKELITVKEEIEKALKVKIDFLNSITHELRTPLYAINSITHMIKKNAHKLVEPSQIDILTFSGDHLLRFVNDVIDFNLGANNLEFNYLKLEPINLKDLLHKIEKTITYSLIMNNDNKYTFDFDPDLSKNLKIDSLKLSRIIINILNNASKYTQDGAITLMAKQLNVTNKTSTIAFSITDNGLGISKAQLAEIDTAFNRNLDLIHRIDNKASGLGMGLVMVNRLLKIYNSKLRIESETGIGTSITFNITFDNDTKSIDLPKTDFIATIKQKRHILVVDDNKINQMVTSKIIKNQGNTCDVAKSGEEAITMFKAKTKYDFILMDIMMPGMDGFEATDIIKSISPDQRIIALTAISLRENKQKFIDSGFEHVIEKPFKIDKFNMLIS